MAYFLFWRTSKNPLSNLTATHVNLYGIMLIKFVINIHACTCRVHLN